MCGIVGAVARDNIVPVLLEGLRRLEYRGYDSSGLALLNGKLNRVRTTGRVTELSKLVNEQQVSRQNWYCSYPMGYTWRTPSERNAHPHFSGETSKVAVVHNGIIENHEALHKRLKDEGFEV